jgi:hypothetical protein
MYNILSIGKANMFVMPYLHPNKIIGVCPQIFDSVIRDWLGAPPCGS